MFQPLQFTRQLIAAQSTLFFSVFRRHLACWVDLSVHQTNQQRRASSCILASMTSLLLALLFAQPAVSRFAYYTHHSDHSALFNITATTQGETDRQREKRNKMMIMRAIKVVASVLAACSPFTTDAFVYRSVAATSFAKTNGNSISRQHQAHEIVWKTTKGVDNIVAKDKTINTSPPAGDLLAKARVRIIPRVPSALYPEGVVRRVDTPLRMFEDGREVSASLRVVLPPYPPYHLENR